MFSSGKKGSTAGRQGGHQDPPPQEDDGTTEHAEGEESSAIATFTQQVAGHKGADQMLCDASGATIYKPVNEQEVEFYRLLSAEMAAHPQSIPTHFFANFFGVVQQNGRDYIRLENLTKGMQEPCVCDLKMGGNSKGHNPDAGKLKEFKQTVVESITTSSSLGFRMVGLRTYREDTGTYVSKSMLYGTKLNAHTMVDGIQLYLNSGVKIRYDVIPNFLKQLDKIIAWMENQRTFRFLSSSILLIYDGAGTASDVRMIDFAHSFANTEEDKLEDGGKDELYLFGLQNLRRILEELFHRNSTVAAPSTAAGAIRDLSKPQSKKASKAKLIDSIDAGQVASEIDLLSLVTSQDDKKIS